MFICVTEVDFITKIPCTVEPQRTGPSFPNVKGFKPDWADKSTWPVEMNAQGVYTRAPKYYGTCDDDADTTLPGVLEVLSEQEYNQRKYDEFYARRPYASWIWNPDNLTWNSPVPYPNLEEPGRYMWDESTVSWKDIMPPMPPEEPQPEST